MSGKGRQGSSPPTTLSLSIGLWPSFHEAWYELGKVSVSWFNKDLEQRLAKLVDVETMDIL